MALHHLFIAKTAKREKYSENREGLGLVFSYLHVGIRIPFEHVCLYRDQLLYFVKTGKRKNGKQHNWFI